MGLLPTPQRLQSGYRDYGAGTVAIISLIKQMQDVGFTLRELTHFVHLLETDPHNPAERRACVEAKLQSIDEQIERLRSMRNELSTRLQTCECCTFAARHPEVLRYAPCYCGCENIGHKSVLDCFIKGRDANGGPQWDSMGFTWDVCLDVARDAMTMYHKDRPMAEIQREIDSRHGRKRRTRTPTAKPPMEEKH